MISINMFVSNSQRAVNWYEKTLKAVVIDRAENQASFKIGNNLFALADENEQLGSKSPLTLGASPICLQLFVDSVHETMSLMLTNGGKLIAPSTAHSPIFIVRDMECCNVVDPFGYVWSIAKQK